MTDKRWNQLVGQRGHRLTTCLHPRGNYCTAYKNGKCIALANTHFRNKDCPFFRDTTTMSPSELEQYNVFVENIATERRDK